MFDLSPECALAARRNGYDATFSGELTSLPFADASFDYVVSLDVLGHIEAEEKDAVLAEIKRVLRPGGVTLARHRVHRSLPRERATTK